MGWKWPWENSDSSARLADSTVMFLEHLRDLRSEVASQRALVDRLMAQLAERDAQIRMVLEERFYRPVPAAGSEQQVVSAVVPADLNDVTQYDGSSDEDWLKQEDRLMSAALAKRAAAKQEGTNEKG